MYCNKCGALLADGSVFCSKCGVKLAVQGVQNQMQNQGMPVNEQAFREQNETRELLRNLDVALPIYQKVAEYDDRIQQLMRMITNSLPFGVILLIGGGILFCSLFLAGVIGYMIRGISAKAILILTALFFIASIVGLLFLQKTKEGSIRRQIQELQQEVDNYIRQNLRPELFYLPEPYQYYTAASYIRDCIVNRRARNLTEAINLYEDQLHKWQMENYQQMIYQVQLQQAAIMRYRR